MIKVCPYSPSIDGAARAEDPTLTFEGVRAVTKAPVKVGLGLRARHFAEGERCDGDRVWSLRIF